MSIVSTSIRLYAWQTNYETIGIIQGEAVSRTIRVQLYDQSEPLNILGDLINLYGTKPDGTVLYIHSDTVDAANGIIDITLTSQFATVAGDVPCFIQIIRPGGMDLRFSGLTVKVEACNIEDALESSNDFSALQVLLGNLAEIEQNVENIVNGALSSYLSKTVYDPQNKATDIFQEIANKYSDARNMNNANSGTLAVARGGTGQTTIQAFRNSMGLGNTTGALPIANGGTGSSDAAAARTALGITPPNIGAAPTAHNHAAGDINSGTLAVANGGTGQTSLQAFRNAAGLGNTTGALPIANGGTGQTTVAAARNALGLGNTGGAVPVANGGTGAANQADALTNLGIVYAATAPTVVNGTYWFQPNE